LVGPARSAHAEEAERLTVRARVTFRGGDYVEIKPIDGPAGNIAALWGKRIDVSSATRVTTLDGKNRLRSLRSGMIVDIVVDVRPSEATGGPGLGCGITINGKPGCGAQWDTGAGYQRGVREAVTIAQVGGSCVKGTARLGDRWFSRAEVALCRVRDDSADQLMLTIDVRGGTVPTLPT